MFGGKYLDYVDLLFQQSVEQMSLPRSYNRGMIDHHSDTFALNERQILFEASGACDNFAANAFRKDCNKQKKKNEGSSISHVGDFL